MADIISSARRSRLMSKIRSSNTEPERVVRSHLHRGGLRFRLNARDLPGSPDIVLPRWRVAIFVHGCFWHRHAGCPYAYTPKSNRSSWKKKFSTNVARDARKLAALQQAGWRVYVVWECELTVGRLNQLMRRVRR